MFGELMGLRQGARDMKTVLDDFVYRSQQSDSVGGGSMALGAAGGSPLDARADLVSMVEYLVNENEDKDSEIQALKETVAELQDTMMVREERTDRERLQAERHAEHLQHHRCNLALQSIASKLWAYYQQRCSRSLTGGMLLLRSRMCSLTPRPNAEAIMPRDTSAARSFGADSTTTSAGPLEQLQGRSTEDIVTAMAATLDKLINTHEPGRRMGAMAARGGRRGSNVGLLGSAAGGPVGGEKRQFVTCLGGSFQVPQWLRFEGRVEKRTMSKHDLLQLSEEVWREKHAAELYRPGRDFVASSETQASLLVHMRMKYPTASSTTGPGYDGPAGQAHEATASRPVGNYSEATAFEWT
jgi:hypothetical protein